VRGIVGALLVLLAIGASAGALLLSGLVWPGKRR
jgi:hypothetical protein